MPDLPPSDRVEVGVSTPPRADSGMSSRSPGQPPRASTDDRVEIDVYAPPRADFREVVAINSPGATPKYERHLRRLLVDEGAVRRAGVPPLLPHSSPDLAMST